MKVRALVGLLLLGLLPLPAQAAVTVNQLETLVTSTAGVPFRQRIEFWLVSQAESVAAEATNTARHTARAQLAAQILQSPDNFVTEFSQAVVVQLPLSSTSMVTVNSVPNADVDTADGTIAANIAGVWNDFLGP